MKTVVTKLTVRETDTHREKDKQKKTEKVSRREKIKQKTERGGGCEKRSGHQQFSASPPGTSLKIPSISKFFCTLTFTVAQSRSETPAFSDTWS